MRYDALLKFLLFALMVFPLVCTSRLNAANESSAKFPLHERKERVLRSVAGKALRHDMADTKGGKKRQVMDDKFRLDIGMCLFLLMNGIVVVCIVIFTHRDNSLVSDAIRDVRMRANGGKVKREIQGDDGALDGKCWMCGKPLGHPSRFPVRMHGEHNKTKEGNQVRHSWRELTIGVPCCMDCIGIVLNGRSNVWKVRLMMAVVVGSALALIPQFLMSDDASAFFSLLCFAAGVGAIVAVSAVGNSFAGEWKLGEFPIVKIFRGRGWKFHKNQKFDAWAMWTMAIIGFAAVFFGIQIYTNALRQIDRESSYRQTSAYVDKVMRITRNFITHYSVDYSYVVDGRRFSGKSSVDDYNRSTRSIDIFYDEQNPSKSTIEKKTSAGGEMCALVVLLLIGGAFGFVSILGLLSVRAAKRRYLIAGGVCSDND